MLKKNLKKLQKLTMFFQILRENKAMIILVMLPLKMEEEDKEVFLILIFLNTFQIYLKIFLEKVLAEVEEEEEGLTIEALT